MIDLFSLMLGFYALGACLVIVGVLAWAWRWVNRYLDARLKRAQARQDAPEGMTPEEVPEAVSGQPGPPSIVPRFGPPELVKYFPEDYEAPLRCSSGVRCGGVLLTPGDTFLKIPSVGDPEERFLVVCSEDITVYPGNLPPESYSRGAGA